MRKMLDRLAKTNFWAKGYYQRSLITILLLSSLPGIIVGLIVYLVVKDQVEYKLQQTYQIQLEQTMQTVEDQFSNVEILIAHWAFDSKFNESLTQLDFKYGYKQIHDLYRTLLIMEGTNPLFQKVELFVNTPEPVVFTKDSFNTLEREEQRERYEQLLKHEKPLFWINSDESVSLVHKIPGVSIGKVKAYGALIIQLDQSKVFRLLEVLTSHNQGVAFLYDEHHEFLFRDGKKESITAFEQALHQQVMEKQESKETFQFQWDDTNYSVNYGTFERLGVSWHYVSATQISYITSPVITLSQWILGTSFFVFLGAIILSWLASQRLYSPIANLLKMISYQRSSVPSMKDEFQLIELQWNNLSRESKILQTRVEQQLPYLQEGFLLQLLQGNMFQYSEEELQERMHNFGWDIAGKQFVIILVELVGFNKLEGRFSSGDEGLVTFAAANMMEELVIRSDMQADIINFYDLSIGLLVALPVEADRDQRNALLYQISDQMILSIGDILKMSATITISRTTTSIKRLADLYEEARVALRFRNFQESSQIIDLTTLNEEERYYNSGFEYPFDMEKDIIYSLRIGDEASTVAHIHQFIAALKSSVTNETLFKQAVLQLQGNLLNVILQSGINNDFLFGTTDLYGRLSELRDPDEIIVWFEQKIIGPFIGEWAQRKDQHMRKLVERTIVLLQENYSKDISLDYCADEIKISSFALSKGFKEITGVNFVDYLMNIRLDKAKQLLCHTEMKISEVAESVGYQHSYFNRVFKKCEGITPSQYRDRKGKREGMEQIE